MMTADVGRLFTWLVGISLFLPGGACTAEPDPGRESATSPVWNAGPPLPRPVANNAVVGVSTVDGPAVFSMLGIDTTKAWDGVVNWSFRWNIEDSVWTEVAPVPGPGRLAGTAQAWGGRVYLFGGYTVAEDGSEASVATVDIYDPSEGVWTTAAPMPVPVDDAVSGIWRDSLVVIVSGWHDNDNVSDVQIYDPARDQWLVATPIPGPPVFGHAGAISGDAIVYRDGARVRDESPRFVLAGSAWVGRMDTAVPGRVEWHEIPEPGPPLYRAAAAAAGDWVLFAGGTDNPYNYNGIGYDGRPAEPRAGVSAFHVPSGRWVDGPRLPAPSMDHRALARVGGFVVLAGGMGPGRVVSDRVWIASVADVLSTLGSSPAASGPP